MRAFKRKGHYPHSDFSKETYFKKDTFREQLYTARLAGYDIYVNTVRKLYNCLQARRERGQIRIMDIFQEGWEDFKRVNARKLTRPAVIDSVEKTLLCGSMDMGFMIAECPKCGNSELIRFTCKSRFCPSCGKKYRDMISASVQETLYDVPHRQFVFSVPEGLRIWFRKHRELLDVLFDSVAETLNEAIFASAPKARKKGTQEARVHIIPPYIRKGPEMASAPPRPRCGKLFLRRRKPSPYLVLPFRGDPKEIHVHASVVYGEMDEGECRERFQGIPERF